MIAHHYSDYKTGIFDARRLITEHHPLKTIPNDQRASRPPPPHGEDDAQHLARSIAITLQPSNLRGSLQPRARGEIVLSSKHVGGRSAIDGLRQSGAFKAVFPRTRDQLECIVVNTAGGLAGGDQFQLTAHAGEGTRLSLTTQAAERAYRALPGETAHVRTRLSVAKNALLHWLPQELILFDGCAIDRRLSIDLDAEARLLMVEPVIFGRALMGEAVTQGSFRDRIEVTRDGSPLYLDGIWLSGDIAAQLSRPAVAAGSAAMASLLYVAPDAPARLAQIRAYLPATGGAGLLNETTLTVRLVCPDGFELRKHLLPILDALSDASLPISWRL
jgi:urease accessory protein